MGPSRRRRQQIDDDFEAFYAARGKDLRNTAYLLCGDWHLAEDLTQITFTKLYRAWSRIERHDVVDQYARRVLLRVFLDERRRPWRREYATVPDHPALETIAPDDAVPDERMALTSAMSGLSKRHRAVLVLRYWADLSVEQVAELLGCSTGTVKSQTARGLANLRAEFDAVPRDLERHMPGGHL